MILDDSNVIGHSTYVGGIIGSAGFFRSKIENCKTTKAVKVYRGNSAYSEIGGIVGLAMAGTEIIRCRNAADIICRECNSSNQYIGGITGAGTFAIRECANYGDIYVSGTGDICVGGISMGTRSDDLITSCCNYGKISYIGSNDGTDGGADLSGICVGFADTGDYDSVNCYNAGMISAGVGDNWGYGIGHGLNVYSVGTVSAASNGQAAALCIPYDTRTLGKGYWLSGTAPAGIEMWKDLSPEERAQIDTSSYMNVQNQR